MKRGDLVIVAMAGDDGKPRPALVSSPTCSNDTHASVTVAPVTSTIVSAPLFRLTVEPSADTGLRSVSQIMIDKITAAKRERVGRAIGRLDDETMLRVSRAIALWFRVAT